MSIKNKDIDKRIDTILEELKTSPKFNPPLVLTVKKAAEQLEISIPTLRDHFLCRSDFPKIYQSF